MRTFLSRKVVFLMFSCYFLLTIRLTVKLHAYLHCWPFETIALCKCTHCHHILIAACVTDVHFCTEIITNYCTVFTTYKTLICIYESITACSCTFGFFVFRYDICTMAMAMAFTFLPSIVFLTKLLFFLVATRLVTWFILMCLTKCLGI